MKILHPNTISCSRIVLAPVVVIFYYLSGAWSFVGTVIFIVAAYSDYLDGKIARQEGPTKFGAFIDPVADKVLIVTILLALLTFPNDLINHLLLSVFAAMIILRELVQSALRDWMSQQNRTNEVAVSNLSKLKTVIQMIALGFLLSTNGAIWLNKYKAFSFIPDWLVPTIGLSLLGIATVLGLYTLGQFLRIAFKSFQEN